MTVAEYNKSVDDFADRLYRFSLKMVKDVDMANDVVQETFTRLWEKKLTVDPNKIKSYIFTAAYRIILNEFRENKKVVYLDEYNEQNHLHSDQYTDVKEILNKALDQLPDIQKSVIMLRDYEGYSYQDIAEITKLSESQVKVYIYRGRMSLKQAIGSIDAIV